MDEDWKGEQFIRSRKPTGKEREMETRRVMNSLQHKKRRLRGEGMPPKLVTAHSAFMKSALFKTDKS